MKPDLNKIQACIEHVRYPETEISWQECEQYYTEYKPGQMSKPLNKMQNIAGNLSEDMIYDWFYEFNSYSLSFSNYEMMPNAIFRLQKSLKAQKNKLEKSGADDEIASRFKHIVDVALASTYLIADSWQHKNRSALDSFRELYEIIHEDETVDNDERLITDLLDEFMHGFFNLGSVDKLLSFVKAGIPIPESGHEPMFVSNSFSQFSAVGGAGKAIVLYKNKGTEKAVLAEKDLKSLTGYSIIPDDDERLEGRIIDSQCFSFALSHYYLSDTYAGEEIQENYRSVDLRTEKAKAGDVILYTTPDIWKYWGSLVTGTYNPLVEFDHLAVVAKVDENGFPTMVMSKFGQANVYEHPIDEAPLSFGIMWTIYRKK